MTTVLLLIFCVLGHANTTNSSNSTMYYYNEIEYQVDSTITPAIFNAYLIGECYRNGETSSLSISYLKQVNSFRAQLYSGMDCGELEMTLHPGVHLYHEKLLQHIAFKTKCYSAECKEYLDERNERIYYSSSCFSFDKSPFKSARYEISNSKFQLLVYASFRCDSSPNVYNETECNSISKSSYVYCEQNMSSVLFILFVLLVLIAI